MPNRPGRHNRRFSGPGIRRVWCALRILVAAGKNTFNLLCGRAKLFSKIRHGEDQEAKGSQESVDRREHSLELRLDEWQFGHANPGNRGRHRCGVRNCPLCWRIRKEVFGMSRLLVLSMNRLKPVFIWSIKTC